MGITPVLAQKVYSTLAEYEKLTGKKIEKFNEAPSLKIKVAAGEIPPVEGRLPEEPLVLEPREEIGRYGGTYKTGQTMIWAGSFDRECVQDLFTLSSDLKTIVPQIAKGGELSEDYRTFTVYLRKGMKWSDGAPFTADDIMFWYEDIILNDELTPVKPSEWSPGRKFVEVEKIDDYTVRFHFATPYPIIIERSCQGHPFAPKHYLKKYHIRYNPKANDVAKEEGYDNWWQCFLYHNKGRDVNFPTLDPWVLTKIDTSGNQYRERNPYYWKVDTAGNQLPYIDKQVTTLVENVEVYNLKAIAGEFTAAGWLLSLKNYPLYKRNEEKGNYHVILQSFERASECALLFNYNHKDPVLKKIFNDIRWRKAMSLAINREEINNILFFGRGTPRQPIMSPSASFYEDWMGNYYIEYDPERANELLDEMGLKWDKEHRYRLRPDGKVLAITIEFNQAREVIGKILELIKGYWEKVGVKVALKGEQASFYQQRLRANECDMGVWAWGGATELESRLNPGIRLIPPWHYPSTPLSGIEWRRWYDTGGEKGEEPPEEIKELFKAFEDWQASLYGTEEYLKAGRKILTINAKGLYAIGTVGLVPKPCIIKNSLRNFPRELNCTQNWWRPYCMDQWFLEE